MAMFFRTRRLVRPRAADLRGGATLDLRLLAAADRLLRPLARASVRLRPLATHREAPAMADPAIAPDLGQPLDRRRAVAPEIALHLELGVDERPEPRHLLVREVADLLVRVELELLDDLPGGRRADPVDVGEPDLEPLLGREIDACDSCHLALPLLVTRVRADDDRAAVPLDHA